MITLESSLLQYQTIRQQTETICKPLATEDFTAQPSEEVSPPKWHLGHSTWFFENFILKKYFPDYRVFNEKFDFLFNSYYISQGERLSRDSRGSLIRPTVKEVYAYRAHVDKYMEILLGQYADKVPQMVLETGLNHEQQHQELLLMDIKFIYGSNPLFPAYLPLSPEDDSTQSIRPILYLDLEEGLYDIGHVGDAFCFDNEKGVHNVFLHSFKIADRLITNAEYLEFIAAGAYQDFRHWLSDGWDWVQKNNIIAPLYWKRKDGEWQEFTLNGLTRLKPEAPVCHISYYEAEAYASWAGRRLATEFEWEVACKQYASSKMADWNTQDKMILHPKEAQNGQYQFFGDAWEWTGSAYLPYPYFQEAPGALGEYNGKFMANQMVLRGGACVSPANHIRSSYRNFFHCDMRWAFTGIRLADHS